MNPLLLAAHLLLAAPAPPAARVWLCVSPTAYAYHRRQGCDGLGRCTHAVRVAEAKKAGKYPCYRC